MASCSSTVSTRKTTEVWLVGKTSATLKQTKLPSKQEVLCLFFHYKSEKNMTVRSSAEQTAIEVMSIWDMVKVPTQLKKHVINKIESLFNEWKNLKKNKENKKKRSEALKEKEMVWQKNLEGLLDIAHANALNMIRIQDYKDFLLNQRLPGRPGTIGNIDKSLAKKETEKEKKKERLEKMKRKQEEEIKTLNEIALLLESNSSSSEDESDMSENNLVTLQRTNSEPPEKRGRKKLLDDNLAVSLDVAKLSDRKATIVLTNTLKSVGCDPSLYNVNKSSIRRQRIVSRKNIAESLKEQFTADVPLTVHWDGKLIEDIVGHQTVDRLPILVSGKGVDQLLAVPKLENGTGELTASAVCETLLAWGVSSQIKCMCFDTTSVNTGLKNGACILLEQKLGKEVLWLACRHHIMEIMLEAVVVQALGGSTGPEILLFKRFSKGWPTINQNNFKSATTDVATSDKVKNIAPGIISFAKNQLEEFQPRDDYKELLNLAIIFLGGVPEKGISFRAPAGIHRARWMAKSIYSLKIYLFRDQFKLTKKEEKSISEICIFTVMVYVKYWFVSSSACKAPNNDLELLKDLKKFEEINSLQSKLAMKKFLGHLWYLSEELVAFAFFDESVSNNTKKKMVSALKNEGIEHPLKRVLVDPGVVLQKTLENFVSKNTLRFFSITGISSNFLEKDVELWEQDEDFKYSKTIACSMRVVNDIAERGVALIEEYNKLITANEEQKQYLLLIVKNFRQKYSDCKKSTLLQ